jgi:opacity protein-like surface antigen
VSGYEDSDYGTGPAKTDVDLDWLATFRGRVGRLVSDDLLLYGTAGLAIAHATETEATSAKTYVNKNTHFGVAAGAGAEWMLSNGVSLRAEALYVHLSEKTYGTDLPVDADADGVIGRIGVGIRF